MTCELFLILRMPEESVVKIHVLEWLLLSGYEKLWLLCGYFAIFTLALYFHMNASLCWCKAFCTFQLPVRPLVPFVLLTTVVHREH